MPHSPLPPMPVFEAGWVWLAGAGPGDPDLLTIKALRCAAETIDIGVDSTVHKLKAGETKRFALDGGEPIEAVG